MIKEEDKLKIRFDFKKRLVLFGENKFAGKDTLLVIESELDVIYAWGHGVKDDMDICATMGTNVTPVQLQKMCNYNEVILAFDNDRYGKGATEFVKNSLLGKTNVKIFNLFGGEDLGNVAPEDLKNIREDCTGVLKI